uniref:Uncharacterized protein n=1 Tax=Paramoeba aestuarina TaxID=180227 RepID=A0A7S4P4W8_9EUKA|mmetsp:Transcript_36172/g.56664  ORF Transcript_36172/g.56664 Transcript_36172/m.56664 type:complete len:311 (+) Transcript_36172:387-1319(+)
MGDFVLVSRVKQKGIAFLKDKKEKFGPLQVLPPVSPHKYPHSSPYRVKFSPLSVRIDMISANFNVCDFLGLLGEEAGEGKRKGYRVWVENLVKEVREEEPWLLDERDVERFISLFVGAKQLRQTMIGEAFRGSLNKIVALINNTALHNFLSSPLFVSSLSPFLSLDCVNNDEVVFTPNMDKFENEEEVIRVLSPKLVEIQNFYENLMLEMKEGKKQRMCPVRVELFSLKKIETTFHSHPGLLEGNFGFVDEVLWSSEENNKKHKKKLVNVPPGLSLLFFKHVEGLELEEKDYYFEHDGMICKIVDNPFPE